MKLAKILAGLLCLGLLHSPVQMFCAPLPDTYGVTLAWNPSPSPDIASYRLYYGTVSGNYSSSVAAGGGMDAVVSGLSFGVIYYFAITAVGTEGLESPFSNEVSYQRAMPGARLQIRSLTAGQFMLTVTGPAGRTYDIEATPDFKIWAIIGTVTLGAGGAVNFTDANAPNFQRRFYRTRENTGPSGQTPPPVAQLQISGVAGGQFVLTVTGPAGRIYDIEATQDFLNWTVIGTGTIGAGGSLVFTDTNAASFSRRFYRARDVSPVTRMQIHGAPGGQFRLTVTGLAGQAYNIEATEDFMVWTVIGTGTMGAGGSLDFTDTNAASFSKRFYRTRGVSP